METRTSPRIIVNKYDDLKSSGFDIHSYDKIIIYFSGGKDSIALFLYCLEQGVDKNKIEFFHHDIDGREGSNLMDWPITRGYCKKFADDFGVKIFFSWKKHGFEGEMLRDNSLTAPIMFEDENNNIVEIGGTRGTPSTRNKFPQVSPDLSVRWCSAYLKIDVGASAIRNQERFQGIRTLTLSGERAEESSARSKYNVLEPDRSDNRGGKRISRYVDRFRPIKEWSEQQVWDIIQRYKVRVHPAYYMGWGRVSCLFCIFGNSNQWASAAVVSPCGSKKISDYESKFGTTIKRKESVPDLIAKGQPYEAITPELLKIARSEEYSLPVVMTESETWVLPAGAFGESCGPL